MDTSPLPGIEALPTSPILRLPPELFLSIAVFCVLLDAPTLPKTIWTPSTKRIIPGTLGWINITHVCHLWRQLCLHTPYLWTHWVGRLPRFLPTIFKRAGLHLPLHVDVNKPSRFLEAHPKIFWEQLFIPITQTASLILYNEETIADAESRLSLSGLTGLRNLEHLNINALTYSMFMYRRDLSLPMLRSAQLCRSSFTSLNVPRLTELTLKRHPHVIVKATLHALLSTCTEIVKVAFINCTFGELPEADATSVVKLDRLRELDLIECSAITDRGWSEISDLFLQLTSLPPSAKLRIALDGSEDSIFEDCVTGISFCWEATSREPFNAPCTLILHPHGLDIIRHTPCCSIDDTAWFHPALVGTERCATIVYDDPRAGLIIADCLPKSSAAQFGSITGLSLHLPYEENMADTTRILRELFIALSSLRTLRLHDRLLCDLLRPQLWQAPGSSTVQWTPIMPHLHSLWLDGKVYRDNIKFATSDLLALAQIVRDHRRTAMNGGFLSSPRVLYLQDFGPSLPHDPCIQTLRDVGIDVIVTTSTAVE